MRWGVTRRSLVFKNVPLEDALYGALVAVRVEHHFSLLLLDILKCDS